MAQELSVEISDGQSNKSLRKADVEDKKPKKLSKKAMVRLVWDIIKQDELKCEPVPKREVISQMIKAGFDEKITKDLIIKLLKAGLIYKPKNEFYRTIDD